MIKNFDEFLNEEYSITPDPEDKKKVDYVADIIKCKWSYVDGCFVFHKKFIKTDNKELKRGRGDNRPHDKVFVYVDNYFRILEDTDIPHFIKTLKAIVKDIKNNNTSGHDNSEIKYRNRVYHENNHLKISNEFFIKSLRQTSSTSDPDAGANMVMDDEIRTYIYNFEQKLDAEAFDDHYSKGNKNAYDNLKEKKAKLREMSMFLIHSVMDSNGKRYKGVKWKDICHKFLNKFDVPSHMYPVLGLDPVKDRAIIKSGKLRL